MALRLTDLNDYIAPSQACVVTKPMANVANAAKDTTTPVQVKKADVEEPKEKATITLNDCLACSGCITSAESVLIGLQSAEELTKFLADAKGRALVVSVSPQTRASFAAKYDITTAQTARKLTALFHDLCAPYGVQCVVTDTAIARHLALTETAREFCARYRAGGLAKPMLASACPGWICYAEKTLGGDILPLISTTRSPQQIMGGLVKRFLPSILRFDQGVYHVSVMPCYDKKLEASRKDFESDLGRDVDCVLSSEEIERMLPGDFTTLSERDMDDVFGTGAELFRADGSGSGGYLEFILQYAAHDLFTCPLPVPVVTDKPSTETFAYILKRPSRSSDAIEYILTVNGEEQLHCASAWGFRHIQNTIRTMSRKHRHFIEIMACPSGCLNGGGQLLPRGVGRELSADMGVNEKRAFVKAVEQTYDSDPVMSPLDAPIVSKLYRDWLGDDDERIRAELHTQYHNVKETSQVNPLAVQW